MSHPIPTHDYGENEHRPYKRLSPSKLKAYSHKLLKEGGVVTRAKHDALLSKKVNAGTGRRLTKKEQAYKTRNWPKAKGDWFKQNGNGGKPDLPPGYKQSDLD